MFRYVAGLSILALLSITILVSCTSDGGPLPPATLLDVAKDAQAELYKEVEIHKQAMESMEEGSKKEETRAAIASAEESLIKGAKSIEMLERIVAASDEASPASAVGPTVKEIGKEVGGPIGLILGLIGGGITIVTREIVNRRQIAAERKIQEEIVVGIEANRASNGGSAKFDVKQKAVMSLINSEATNARIAEIKGGDKADKAKKFKVLLAS